MTHELKTETQFFDAIISGKKTFEVRYNDRDYQLGDLLILKEYYPHLKKYSGNETTRRITYILEGGQFGIDDNYIVMGIQ